MLHKNRCNYNNLYKPETEATTFSIRRTKVPDLTIILATVDWH